MSGHTHLDDQVHFATIFSRSYQLIFRDKADFPKIQQALCLWIEVLKEWCQSNNCVVGHIKIFVQGPNNLWISSTGKAIDVKHLEGQLQTDEFNLNITAIIFGTSEQALHDAAKTWLEACLGTLCSYI